MEWIGYVGLAAFVFAWIPQSFETVRAGRCAVNTVFLLLSGLGSIALVLYAAARRDTVFSILNSLTTVGAFVNLYYKLRPRTNA